MTPPVLVHRPERCPDNPKLSAFIAWWSANGPFPITVTSGDRTDGEQRRLYAQGRTMPGKVVTNARTAAESPHGRTGAIDCLPVRELYPAGAVKLVFTGDEEDPLVRAEGLRRLRLMAGIAEDMGLQSGRSFPGLHDLPHLQDPDWQSRPLSQ